MHHTTIELAMAQMVKQAGRNGRQHKWEGGRMVYKVRLGLLTVAAQPGVSHNDRRHHSPLSNAVAAAEQHSDKEE